MAISQDLACAENMVTVPFFTPVLAMSTAQVLSLKLMSANPWDVVLAIQIQALVLVLSNVPMPIPNAMG